MRYMGGCTECHSIWWGCRCPLRCEECGAGYRGDSISNCGTPNCRAGERRYWAMTARLAEGRRESEAETIDAATVQLANAILCEDADAASSEVGSRSVTPSDERASEIEGETVEPALSPAPAPRRRPSVQNGQARKPDPRSAARPSARTDEPAHRPVADRRAAVEALLTEGLSDREIARRVKVSPSTVSAVRKSQEDTKIGA